MLTIIQVQQGHFFLLLLDRLGWRFGFRRLQEVERKPMDLNSFLGSNVPIFLLIIVTLSCPFSYLLFLFDLGL